MTDIPMRVVWQRGEQPFVDGKYSRVHQWEFDGGTTVPASSSPHVVPIPMSDETCVDPEEAFVASLSSCHMLWFLAIAGRKGFVVDRYIDACHGKMEKNEDGKLAVTEVFLFPEVHWGDSAPTPEQATEMHELAHHECFIANSVKSKIHVAQKSP